MSMRALTWTVLSAALSAQEPAQVCLRHKLDPGTKFAFAIEVDSSLEFTEARRNSKTNFTLHFTASCGVTTNGIADVVCTLRRLRARVEAPNANLVYDSDEKEPPTGPLRKLEDLIDAEFTVRVQPDGTLAEVVAPAPLAALAQDQLGTDFRSLFAAYFTPLPPQPVAVGATWEAPTILFGEHPGQGATPAKHQLQSVEKDVARIEISYDAPKPAPRPGVRFELRESAGEVHFQIATGRLLSATATLLARATKTSGDGDASATSRLEMRASAIEMPLPKTGKGQPDEREEGKPGR